MKIHNVVLIIYLESIINVTLNPYKRHFIVSSFVIVDNEKEYEIERLIRKRLCRFGRVKQTITQYLIR